MKPNLRIVVLLACLLPPSFVHATCTTSTYLSPLDGNSALIPFGRINLTDTYLQPVGTLLASTIVPPTNYTYNGATASTVLWDCAVSDLSSLYFLVATNGDDRVGGFYQMDGLPGVYATWFQYVGIKQTMAGVTLSRTWQRIPLTSYAISGDRVHIRLQDIPPLQAELYRLASLPANGAVTNYCNNMGTASATGTVYSCTQPNSYIQLVGPGLLHDEAGEDSAYNYDFWGTGINFGNGFGYGMRTASSLSNTAACVARNATPLVLFQTMTVQQLQDGASAQANFNVEVECSNQAVSGTASGQTAIGIQVSNGAYAAAQSLGLINGSNGVTALVSDNYGNDPSLASGVGITLRNASTGTAMVFVGQPGLTGNVPSQNPSGANAGWYPVLDGASPLGSAQSNYSSYLQTFTASLQQLSGRTITPGRVYATAYILVKVQ